MQTEDDLLHYCYILCVSCKRRSEEEKTREKNDGGWSGWGGGMSKETIQGKGGGGGGGNNDESPFVFLDNVEYTKRKLTLYQLKENYLRHIINT